MITHRDLPDKHLNRFSPFCKGVHPGSTESPIHGELFRVNHEVKGMKGDF